MEIQPNGLSEQLSRSQQWDLCERCSKPIGDYVTPIDAGILKRLRAELDERLTVEFRDEYSDLVRETYNKIDRMMVELEEIESHRPSNTPPPNTRNLKFDKNSVPRFPKK